MDFDYKKTILLNDDPADLDYFESHQSIAEAINTLIETEKGKKSLALIGNRGSGKSSIINFLKNIFISKKTPNNQIFIFDAWSHSGDPLRRSFIEEFVAFLKNVRWVTDKDKWNNELDVLSKKREERSTKSEPILTFIGKLIITSTIFLPIGYALFGLIDKPLSLSIRGFSLHLWTLGLCIIFLPVIIVILTWLFWRPTWKLWEKRFWVTHRTPHENDSLFCFFIQKVKESNTTTTLQTPNPTTIEFQSLFRNILSSVLNLEETNCNSRKLIIVIDNLDRVDHNEAYAIWSTMRTFFDLWNGKAQKNWLERFCLIVPFAPEFPHDIFQFDDIVEPHETKPTLTISNSAISFVEKTFQSIFYVPFPVLSKWKDYLINQLGEAFPVHKEKKSDVFHQIYRIYDIVKVQKDGPPTPRDLKQFINKIGSRNRIWGNQIELSHQAVYVLYFDEMQKDGTFSFSKWGKIDKRIYDMFDNEKLQRDMAALHFNVKPDIALQTLSGGQIRAALQTGDKNALKTLSENVTGFFTVLEKEVTDNGISWTESEPNTIPMAASAMGVFVDHSAPEWSRIEDQLQTAASKVIEWRSIDEQVAEGLAIIVQRAISKSANSVIDNLIESISMTAPEQRADQGKTITPKTTEFIKQHVRGLIRILKAFESIGPDKLKSKFRIPGTERTYIQILNNLSLESDVINFFQYFIPKLDGAKIVEEFVRICGEGQFADVHSQSIRIATQIDSAWPWEKLVHALQARLQYTNNLTPSEVIGCTLALNYLVAAKVAPNAESVLQDLCTQGHIFHHLYGVLNDSKGFAVCSVPLSFYNPTGLLTARRPGNGMLGAQEYRNFLSNPSTKKDVIDQFCKIAIDVKRLTEFFEKTQPIAEQHQLVSQVLKTILTGGEGHKHLNSNSFIKAYSYYSARMDADLLQKHVDNLVVKDDLMHQLETNGFKKEYASLYIKVIGIKDRKPDQAVSFIDFLLNGLRLIDGNEWGKQLTSESEILELLIRLGQQKVLIELSEIYHDALLKHANDVLDGKAYPNKFLSEWKYAISALSKNWREHYLKNLRDRLFIESEDKKKTAILNLYTSEFIENELLEDKAEDIVRRMLTPIIKRGDVKELIAVENLLKQKPKLFKTAPKNDQNIFSEVLLNALSQNGMANESKETLLTIKTSLGLNQKIE